MKSLQARHDKYLQIILVKHANRYDKEMCETALAKRLRNRLRFRSASMTCN